MQNQGSQGYVDQRFSVLEQNQEQFSLDLQQLQDQLDEGLQALGDSPGADEAGVVEGTHSMAALEEAVQTAERGIAATEKKLCTQIEELASSLASLRVKADGQFHRVASLTERLETAHEPAIESMRSEIAQARAQDRREMEGEMAVCRQRVQEVADGAEDATAEVREALRQARAEIAAISLRPEDNPLLRSIDERLNGQERDVIDLRARFETLPLSAGEAGLEALEGDEKLPEELEETRRRLEWLEEQST